NVARDVVGVGIDPKARVVELALEAQAVVDGDFAGQEDHCEAATGCPERRRGAEAPGLHQVREVRRQRFAAVEAGEILLCMIGDGGGLRLRERLPLLARRERREGELDLLT